MAAMSGSIPRRHSRAPVANRAWRGRSTSRRRYSPSAMAAPTPSSNHASTPSPHSPAWPAANQSWPSPTTSSRNSPIFPPSSYDFRYIFRPRADRGPPRDPPGDDPADDFPSRLGVPRDLHSRADGTPLGLLHRAPGVHRDVLGHGPDGSRDPQRPAGQRA